jgi:hypothetical protein
VAKLAPAAIDAEVDKIEQAAADAMARFRQTLEENPEEGRQVMLGLFDRIQFTPVKTPAGPRFRIEGDAKIGRLLGIEGEPEGAAVLTLCPQGEPEVSAPDLRPVFEDFPLWLGGMTQDEAGLTVNLVAVT